MPSHVRTTPIPQLGLFSDPPSDPSPAALAPSVLPGGEASSSPSTEAPAAPVAEPEEPESRIALTRERGRQASLPAWAYGYPKPPAAPAVQAAATVPRDDPADLFDGASTASEEPARVASRRRIWTVADLVSQVRAHVEDTWADLWVHGEISNLRTAPSGHLYFTLKDGESQLPAVLFRRQAQLLRFRPEDGLEVLLRGKLSVYEQRGQMQLIAEHLEPVGAGSLQIAFEQLKARLAAEGLFNAARKRTLPAYPRCVGIVTSPSGAVIRDFLNVANRRHAALDILLYPAVVQGNAAANEIAAGIAYFNCVCNVDLIVIARGGGSLEDLSPFNSESLARAIAGSALPVVSAIGHETDFTIADFVADLRAPTPSAAAELITAAQHRVEEQVAALGERLTRACRYQLILARQRLGASPIETARARLLENLNRRQQRIDTVIFRMEAALRLHLRTAATRLAECSVDAALGRLRTRLADRRRTVEVLSFRLQQARTRHVGQAREHLQASTGALLRQHPGARLVLFNARWSALETRLGRLAASQLQSPRNRHASLARQLEGLSPLAVLRRGYALVFDTQGNLVKRAADTSVNSLLTVRLGKGSLRTRVEDKS